MRPAVLGWERWRAIEEQYALGMLKGATQEAATDGRIPAELVDPFAHMILATVNELALLIATRETSAPRSGRPRPRSTSSSPACSGAEGPSRGNLSVP